MNIQCSVQDCLSFQRIVDIPFGTCVAALESWQLTGQDGGHRTGLSLFCGPIEHDRDSGTYRIQVRMARGPLRPLLRMRLDIDRWSSSPLQTALELIPCRYVRPSAAYFRAGHFMLDSLVLSLAQYVPTQRLNRVTASQPPQIRGDSEPGYVADVRVRRVSSALRPKGRG
jgi:hypothetical protein